MRKTKKSLLTSVVALLICFSMLLGSTYAWFTDFAGSEDNIIKTGRLNVEMYWSENLLDPDSDQWKSADGVPVFTDDIIWEPGRPEIRYVKIANEGDLSFKWQLSIEAEGAVGVLAEVMDVYYINPVSEEVTSLEGKTSVGKLDKVIESHKSTDGVVLPVGEVSDEYDVGYTIMAIAFHMDESAGNTYQGDSIGDGFTLKLLAAQFNHEKDSTGSPDYDKDAPYFDSTLGGEGSASSNVTTSDNKTVGETVLTNEAGNISATIPEGVVVNPGVNQLTLSVNNMDKTNSNVVVDEDESARSIDVHVIGVSKDNDVVMAIAIDTLLPKALNMGNYRFYHIEDGAAVEMTLLENGATPVHNNYEYDPVTGNVVLYLKSFSEVALVADNENTWKGNIASDFAGGEGTEENPYLIANADQLAYLGYVISNDNANYGDKHYKLIADVDLGGEENAAKGIIFYPIGYTKVGGSIATVDVDAAPEYFFFDDAGEDYANSHVEVIGEEGAVTSWYTYGGAFKGVFDGNGNTIKNIYQNTWQMKGNYDGNYWNAAMGIFGYVYGGTVKNLTVDNFTSDGEFTPTGVVAAYAANSTFENIAIKNCNPRVYNTGNGGIVGVGGNSSDTTDFKLTFTNITVDNSNKISALWGSWDVACGGIMGMFRGNGLVHFENCNVGAQIDVYNDVCGNYQYYWYRYAGMIIGSIRKNTTDANGYTVPDTTGITAKDCTVNFGKWNDYYYCELVANTIASYTHDHQFSRLTKIDSLDEIKSGDTWTKTGNFLLDGECYHIVNKDGVLTRHLHEDAGEEVVNGQTVLKEDKQIVYLPFNQVFQGDGWGVLNIGFRSDSNFAFEGITIGDTNSSIDKFGVLVNGGNFEEGTTVTIGEIFKALDGVSINANTLMVFVSPVGEGSTAGAIYTPNTTDWTKGTLTFSGSGAAKIVISDYTYCKEAVASVTIDKHVHEYTTAVTAPTCTEAGYTTYTCACGYSYVGDEVAAKGHTAGADATCTTAQTCTVCGVELESKLGHVAGADATCTTAQTCTVCGVELESKLGHSYNAAVTAPTCTEAGYTKYTCATCGDTYTADEKAKLNHAYESEVTTLPTCEGKGVKTFTCANDESHTYTEEIAANGHAYEGKVTQEPTCEVDGVMTYTCTNDASHTYTEKIAATGHAIENGECSKCEYVQVVFETKFTGDFLYRVGNANNVALGSLFGLKYDGAKVNNLKVTIEKVNGNASGTFTANNSDWTKGTIKFNDTGIVKVTISADGAEPVELMLEVVEAKNITSKEDATANNVVLLNDISGEFKVANGWAFYGNGFTVTCSGNGSYRSAAVSYGFVTVENGGILDNVKIICDIFPESYAFTTEMKAGSDGRYPYGYSAVVISGNSTISNSYIYGARNNIQVGEGNVTVENTVLECGSLSNIHIKSNSSYTVTLRDLTTIQYQTTSKYDTSKKVLGFGVLVGTNESESNASIVLEGDLKQYNWVTSDDTSVSNSYAKTAISEALKVTQYQYTINGKTAVNIGIAILNSKEIKIADNRTNKEVIPYVQNSISMMTYTGQVYSIKSGATVISANSRYDSQTDKVLPYEANTQRVIMPTVVFNDSNSAITSNNGYNATAGAWQSKVSFDLDNISGGSYEFKFSNLLVTKYGTNLEFTVKDSDGNVVDKNATITLNQLWSNNYILVVTDNLIYGANGTENGSNIIREIPFVLSSTKTSIEPPKFTNAGTATAIRLVDKAGGDWRPAYTVLTGVTVTYWSASESKVKTVDLSTLYSNGSISSNVWTYTCDDFTLTITGGQVHSDGTKITPVVSNNTLYFASTNKAFTTGTTSRSIILTYVFTDKNDSTTWNRTETATYSNLSEYDYSKFKNGTLEAPSSGSSSCIAPDTLITLADGTQVRVDSLTGSEELLVWNMETGKLDKASIMFIDSDPVAEYEVVKLIFSDGTEVKVIYEHGFWDYDLNKYVYLDANAADYIGHTFAKQNVDTLEKVQLVDVVIETEVTTAWSPVTAGHLCYFVNGMLSMPGGVGGLFNIFEVDAETMTYDFEQMEKDIETYGLFTYEELNAICPLTEDMFNAAGGAYLKISIGKGNLTMDELIYMITRYSKYI